MPFKSSSSTSSTSSSPSSPASSPTSSTSSPSSSSSSLSSSSLSLSTRSTSKSVSSDRRSSSQVTMSSPSPTSSMTIIPVAANQRSTVTQTTLVFATASAATPSASKLAAAPRSCIAFLGVPGILGLALGQFLFV